MPLCSQRARQVSMGFWWSLIVLLLGLPGAALAVVALYKRVAKKYPKEKRKSLRQAFVLGSCVLAALLFDEEVVRFFWLPSGWEGLYTVSYAVKWEIAALLATFVITLQYWWDEYDKISQVKKTQFRFAGAASVGAILCLVAAVYFLVRMLFAQSREALLGNFWGHFAFLALLSFFFLTADYNICAGVIADQDPQNDLKNLSHLSVYLVDLPVFLSFLLLGIFCGIHWAQHSLFHFLHPFLHDAPRSLERVNLWTSEEYFMSGAIAFQYLLSTAIYLILALGLVKIETTTADKKTQETRIELPV